MTFQKTSMETPRHKSSSVSSIRGKPPTQALLTFPIEVVRRRTLHQRVLVERLPAPDVDQHGVRAQRRERVRPDQLVGGGRVRQRHHDVVAGAHERAELVGREHLAARPDGLLLSPKSWRLAFQHVWDNAAHLKRYDNEEARRACLACLQHGRGLTCLDISERW